ncbi:MAG TPA: putative glycolipid-binding domain-containing protein [Steroidobacteraceae bacterium]|nr:putative glycolipid-binding domain-containing protein [Steroidobacteraceae bacterium]
MADSVVLAFDEEHGPFRLTYRLTWDPSWQLRDAELAVATERFTRSLSLQTDGQFPDSP